MISVSYTHLDVYKRQTADRIMFNKMLKIFWGQETGKWPEEIREENEREVKVQCDLWYHEKKKKKQATKTSVS